MMSSEAEKTNSFESSDNKLLTCAQFVSKAVVEEVELWLSGFLLHSCDQHPAGDSTTLDLTYPQDALSRYQPRSQAVGEISTNGQQLMQVQTVTSAARKLAVPIRFQNVVT